MKLEKTEEVLLDQMSDSVKLSVYFGNRNEFVATITADGDQTVRVTGKTLSEVLAKVEDVCSLIVGEE